MKKIIMSLLHFVIVVLWMLSMIGFSVANRLSDLTESLQTKYPTLVTQSKVLAEKIDILENKQLIYSLLEKYCKKKYAQATVIYKIWDTEENKKVWWPKKDIAEYWYLFIKKKRKEIQTTLLNTTSYDKNSLAYHLENCIPFDDTYSFPEWWAIPSDMKFGRIISKWENGKCIMTEDFWVSPMRMTCEYNESQRKIMAKYYDEHKKEYEDMKNWNFNFWFSSDDLGSADWGSDPLQWFIDEGVCKITELAYEEKSWNDESWVLAIQFIWFQKQYKLGEDLKAKIIVKNIPEDHIAFRKIQYYTWDTNSSKTVIGKYQYNEWKQVHVYSFVDGWQSYEWGNNKLENAWNWKYRIEVYKCKNKTECETYKNDDRLREIPLALKNSLITSDEISFEVVE